ncbi:hypothetical protein E2542_SST12169 [Spatholobus suberectus]|nr:hypothetical protein E2542_SST12169 [Spatholobus suberectus]
MEQPRWRAAEEAKESGALSVVESGMRNAPPKTRRPRVLLAFASGFSTRPVEEGLRRKLLRRESVESSRHLCCRCDPRREEKKETEEDVIAEIQIT